MSEYNKIHISVRNLVELVLRGGSIDSKYISSVRATEGTRLHQKLQKARKKQSKLNGYEYLPEFAMLLELDFKGFVFEVEGRADAVIKYNDGVAIEEIKTTMRSLENIEENTNPLHWAQAKSYAYIYALQNNLEAISVELTYCQADTEDVKTFKQEFFFEELKIYFMALIESYVLWAEMISKWERERDISIKELAFPYDAYRKGQREFAIVVYKTITKQKKLFAQAPTGTGKTISTLFPSIKAVAEGHIKKIFYLTAKTITRQTAQEAFEIMKKKGLKFKSVTITAKEKICFCEQMVCTPENCTYANGHFDRVNMAIMDAFENENIMDRQVIEKYALMHTVCPFEFSLDLTLWADCIICDYNYVFDPTVYLKRFFQDEQTKDYVFLVDEAHNLIDRAREMYSAELSKRSFLQVKKVVKDKSVGRALKKINDYMLLVMRSMSQEDRGIIKPQKPEEFCDLLREFNQAADNWLAKNEGLQGHQELLECYFTSLDFLRMADFYDERYVTYIENEEFDLRIKLFCLDPSYMLSQAEKRGKTSIFFSATLTPLTYFRETLGGDKEDYFMKLRSPFEQGNLRLLVADNISTKWKYREQSYEIIADYLFTFVSQKVGNYFAFFPSYQYMKNVFEFFATKYTDIKVIIQSSNMKEEEKEDFLTEFSSQNKSVMLAFAVMGGIFSEGIDLTGDRLIGAAIIGVGLPQISMERDVISDYYKLKNSMGYEYAYMYPGMNKVMQSAGRVIRTERDRGAVLLIDERFTNSNYLELFPPEWSEYIKVYNKDGLESSLKDFWRE